MAKLESQPRSTSELEDGETLEDSPTQPPPQSSRHNPTSPEISSSSQKTHLFPSGPSESLSHQGSNYVDRDLTSDFGRLVRALEDSEEQKKWSSEFADLDFEGQQKLFEDLTNYLALQERERSKNRHHPENGHNWNYDGRPKKRGTEEQFPDHRFPKRRPNNGSYHHQRPTDRDSTRRGRWADDFRPWEKTRDPSSSYSSRNNPHQHPNPHQDPPMDMASSLQWSQLVSDLLGITRKPDIDQGPPPPPKHMLKAALLSPEFSYQITTLLEKKGMEPAKIISSPTSASSTPNSLTSSPSLTTYLKLRQHHPNLPQLETYEQMHDRVYAQIPVVPNNNNNNNVDVKSRNQYPTKRQKHSPSR